MERTAQEAGDAKPERPWFLLATWIQLCLRLSGGTGERPSAGMEDGWRYSLPGLL